MLARTPISKYILFFYLQFAQIVLLLIINGLCNLTEESKEKFDVYCFGRVLRQLVLKEKDRWSPTKCPRTLLSDRCIKGEPNERPSMDEVVSKIKVNRDVLSLLRIMSTSENDVLIENFIVQNIQKNEHIEPESSSKKRKKH
jgi:hypothetical protein